MLFVDYQWINKKAHQQSLVHFCADRNEMMIYQFAFDSTAIICSISYP